MFKNCPGEKKGRKNCEECPLFWKCLAKKLRIRMKKNHLMPKILWMAFVIIMLILVAWLNINEAKKKERNRLIEQRKDVAVTKEVTTKEIKVTTLSSKAKIVAKSTSTPIPTRKPETKKQTAKKVETTKGAKPTSTPRFTKKPVKKAAKVAKVKNCLEKKEYSISAEILEAYAELSAYDLKLMEKVVYAESRGEPFKGQIAVAAIVLNRYIFYKKQKSIEEIVTEKYQFAKISHITDEMLRECPSCKKAVKKAISGQDPTRVKFPKGARHFYEPDSPYISKYQLKIREGVEGIKIGCHIFHNDFNE